MLDSFLSWDDCAVVSSFIKASTNRKKGGASVEDILQSIAHVMGVNDVSALDGDANLVDIGLDSLMGMEIKQTIENGFNVSLSMKEIQTVRRFSAC